MDRASLDQEGARVRNDDGSESAATWKEAQDTAATVAANINFRVRFVIDASGNPNAASFQVECKEVLDPDAEQAKVPLT